MLTQATQATRRRSAALTRHAASDAATGLLFPFLCPALARWTSTRSGRPRRQSTGLSPRPVFAVTRDPIHTRHLASVADISSTLSQSHSLDPSLATRHPHLDWDYPLGGHAQASSPSPYRPVMLQHAHLIAPEPRKIRNGIGGTSTELLQNIYTCLRVGRFDRAEACILRLSEQPDATVSEVAHAHEAYLEARFASLSVGVEMENFTLMQRWFRFYVQKRKLVLGANAYIVLIRAALRAVQSPVARCATVRRLCKASDLSDGDLIGHPSLSNKESLALARILQDQYGPPLTKLRKPTKPVRHALQSQTRPEEQYPMSLLSEHVQTVPKLMPEVIKVEQKGAGLESLQTGLLAVDRQRIETGEQLDQAALKLRNTERELLIEASAAAAAVVRWKREEEKLHSLGVVSTLHSRPIGALMYTWYTALLPSIQDEIAEVKKALDANNTKSRTDDRQVYGAFLETLTAENMASNTIIYVLNLLGKDKDRETDEYSSSLKIAKVATGLGKQMQQESNIALTMQKSRASTSSSAQNSASRAFKSSSLTKSASRGAQKPLMRSKRRKHLSTLNADLDFPEWPATVRVRFGAMLLSKLVETATIPITREHPRTREQVTQLQPAFIHKTVYKLGKRQGVLIASPELIRKLHREPMADVICKKLPMIVEPRPWTGFRTGGYLTYSTDFIRFPPTDKTPRDYAIAAIGRGDMKTVFDAINILSKLPWKLNNAVLRVQIDAWNSGKAIGSFAPVDPEVELPPEPAQSADPRVRRQWLNSIQELKSKQAGMHSLRCHQNLQLETARAFRDETIYLPHNIDFRGRAYPLPPYLNHMGADNSRALMTFADGKRLGTSGLRWLKVHLANVAGNDKASLQERVDYVMENIDEVFDSAERPLDGRRWWTKSDDPWQTLAACFELSNALKSPNPEDFVSHLPIHQDGTCNGLQHYAALGGDEIGARQVNLEPGDRPSDVYTAVAEAVKGQIARDFEAGDPHAQILHGRIGRRIVKQPVMTNVYGVTYFGVRAQVRRQLEDILPDIRKNDALNHSRLAAYVANKISLSLNEMFNGAQSLQAWFGKCADRITSSVTPEQIESIRKALDEPAKRPSGLGDLRRPGMNVIRPLFKSSVIWTTPLRLPVVQPYRSAAAATVATSMQTVSLQQPQVWDPVNKRKQLQAFPPNFIHSLDASHMMLSAIKCEERGMTFASIHDSFWTHACDIDKMSSVLRDAFVDMHGENIVGRLREEFMTRYKGSMYLAGVSIDRPIGKRIKAQLAILHPRSVTDVNSSTRNTVIADLLMEQDRLRLLASENPTDRARGEAMVTPGSLFASDPDEASLTLPSEITSTMLGTAPNGEMSLEADDINSDTADDAGEKATTTDGESPTSESMSAQDYAESDHDERETPSKRTLTRRATKSSPRVRKVYVWLPLTFPDVPARGSFDVKRLKDSRYFFH